MKKVGKFSYTLPQIVAPLSTNFQLKHEKRFVWLNMV